MNRKYGYWIAAWLVLVVVVGFLAFGHGRSGYYQAGPGWGAMGGDYRGEGGPLWRGMGPGMMGRGGYGPGWGDDGGWGPMGPNAAGMPGMGYGMGYGMGNGMYGGTMMPWALPDLTPEQAGKLEALQNDASGRQSTLAQQVWAAQATLTRLQAAEKRDWAAIRTAALALHDLQRQRLEAAIELQQKEDALLSDSQRAELARARRGSGWAGAQ